MELFNVQMLTALVSGGFMFAVGFFAGQKSGERRARIYQRIRQF